MEKRRVLPGVVAMVMLGTGLVAGSSPAAAGPRSGELWIARYEGPSHAWDKALAMATSPDGSRVFVTGYSNGTAKDFTTIAYDSTNGHPLWLERFAGPDDDQANAIAVSPDGSEVFVTGSSHGAKSGDDYLTIAYDATTGAVLWLRRFNGRGNDNDDAQSTAVSPDGGTVFVTGFSDSGAVASDMVTVAYDAATGSTRWIRRYNGPANSGDGAYAVAVSPDGSRVFITGFTDDSEGYYATFATVGYDAAAGTTLWASVYSNKGGYLNSAKAIAVSPDGGTVFVAGVNQDVYANDDYLTVAYDAADGSERWEQRYNGPAGGYDEANDLALSPDGSTVFVTGVSDDSGPTFDDYTTLAYSADSGDLVWAARLRGGAQDIAEAVVVSPDGSTVWVTGTTHWAPGGYDYTTEAYDAATGASLTEKKFNWSGRSSDNATALAVSPDGSKVFVTGYSEGSPGDYDFATVVYSTSS